jgi:hypothetical protein
MDGHRQAGGSWSLSGTHGAGRGYVFLLLCDVFVMFMLCFCDVYVMFM